MRVLLSRAMFVGYKVLFGIGCLILPMMIVVAIWSYGSLTCSPSYRTLPSDATLEQTCSNNTTIKVTRSGPSQSSQVMIECQCAEGESPLEKIINKLIYEPEVTAVALPAHVTSHALTP